MQLDAIGLQHDNLSVAVANRIRGLIFDGGLAEGSRINEVQLASDLGVSRTPLREALARLESEGAIQREPRRGYFVRFLTLEEFEHLYPIRGLLDPEALRNAGIPNAETLDALDHTNAEIARESGVDRRIDLDDHWHLALIAGCDNPVLLGLIADFMAKTRRYELAYFRAQANVSAAADEHLNVTRALRNGDMNAACEALRRNLTSGAEPIRQWLQTRKTP